MDEIKRVDVRRKLLSAAQSREPCSLRKVQEVYTSRSEYYQTMEINIRKEFLDCVEGNRNGGSTHFSGTGQAGCGSSGKDCKCKFTAVLKDNRGNSAPEQLSQAEKKQRAEEQKALAEGLKDNIVLVTYCDTDPSKKGNLFWITSCVLQSDAGQDQLGAPRVELQGMSAVGGTSLQHSGQMGQMTLKVVLFAGDFASRYRATLELLAEGAPCAELLVHKGPVCMF
ncbi:unnamed protein product [Polarella glacialis]|uniref:Uncharacterized protein n=1 Tax=Polarella glacialis TaxID=89957 RepID=A0A813JA19_POLGL|nr:unnamed protein product [Polarella glacialis]